MINVNSIYKRFRLEGGFFSKRPLPLQALSNVTFSVKKGEVLALVGESGSGKTTAGKIIAGLTEADAGMVEINGAPVSKMTRTERAATTQMIFQDPTSSLNPKLSVRTILAEALSVRKKTDKQNIDAEKEIFDLLKSVGLPDNCLQNYPHQFSGGQKQRIAIARALAARPKVIIADEPVSSLDLSIQAQILNLLDGIKKSFGLTYIFISHDLAVVNHVADRIVVLKDGKVVEQGDTRGILSSPKHPYTQKLLSAVPSIDKK